MSKFSQCCLSYYRREQRRRTHLFWNVGIFDSTEARTSVYASATMGWNVVIGMAASAVGGGDTSSDTVATWFRLRRAL